MTSIIVNQDKLDREADAEGMFSFSVVPRNPFYFGWLSFLFGYERPDGEQAACGWDTANDCTNPLGSDLLASALRAEIGSGRSVRVATVPIAEDAP